MNRNRIIRLILGIVVFIILIVLSSMVVRPVYVSMTKVLSGLEYKYLDKLGEATGLKISYKYLSPSIFSNINISGIEITEIASGKKIVGIRQAIISYDMEKLASDNPLSALNQLSVSGVEIEYNAVQNSDTLSKILDLVNSDDSEESLNLENLRLPFELIVKDLRLHYSDEMNDLLVKLKQIDFDGSRSAGGEIAFGADGTVTFNTEYVKNGKKRAVFASLFDVSGTFFPSTGSCSATLQLSSSPADYTLSHLNALVNYNPSKIQIRTMRTALPFNLLAEYDFEDSKVHADFSADKFNPFKLVSIKKKNELMQKLNGSIISGSATCDFDLKSNTGKYETNLNLNFPESLIGENFNVVCNAKGTEKKAEVRKIAAVSNSFSVDYSGSLDFVHLKPFGVLNLNYFILQNGSVISTEMFLEPETEGFKCYAPQIFMNELSVTDVEVDFIPKADSIDFAMSFRDYSHYEQLSDSDKKNFSIDGSFITGDSPYIQSHIVISDLFADTIADFASVFLPSNMAQSIDNFKPRLSEYITTGELYFSTDFKSVTYNVPYGFVANFNKNGELLTVAADGSDKTVQISSLNFHFGGQSVQASMDIDFGDNFDDITFSTALSLNSIPYSFYGNVSSEWISISGDYGFDSMIGISDGITGFFQMSDFPVAVGEFILSFSTMSTFTYTEMEGFNVTVARFEATEISENLPASPKITFSGELSDSLFLLNTLSYFDDASELDMGGQIAWNFKDGILNSAGIELYGQSPISTEKMGISASVTNSKSLPFSIDALMENFHLDLLVSIDSFPMSRFFKEQSSENVVNAKINATGTLNSPFVSLEVSSLSLNLSGYPLSGYGNVVLDGKQLSVSDVNADWAFAKLENFSASVDTNTFSGRATAVTSFSLFDSIINVPLELKVESVIDENDSSFIKLPDFYTVAVKSRGARGNLFEKTIPFLLNIVHIPGQFDFSTDNPNGVRGTLNDRKFEIITGKNSYLEFNAEGSLEGENIDLLISDLNADLQKICSVVNIPMVKFNSGRLNGFVRIFGPTTEPEFAGFVDAEELSFNVPLVSPVDIKTENALISAGADGLTLQKAVFSCGNSKFVANADIIFNRWDIDNILFHLTTLGDKGIPIDMNFPFIHAKGDAFANLDLSFIYPDLLSVKGKILANNADVEIVTSELQNHFSLDSLFKMIPETFKNITSRASEPEEEEKEESILNVVADLDLTVGNNVRILFNPFLRGLIEPDTPLSFFIDTESGEFSFVGDVSLHGGEVAWLNRNFYMKEGRIVFNETQDNLDPKITIRAETREQDMNGKRVTIILSALNQPLSQFNPVFTSTPAKSESEILALLGQVISADSESIGAFMMAGGDYLVQTTVVRRIENALRELCNFDIFSIRTNVLQNTLKRGFNLGEDSDNVTAADSDDNRITFGNFFDNSTVYIGKYFGSVIYVDAMFHWTYDKAKLDDGSSSNGLVFQPEFGFEMAAPFANIRFGVSPDIDAVLHNQWVSSTSITLSWKHSF